jgi:hypothetical protein
MARPQAGLGLELIVSDELTTIAAAFEIAASAVVIAQVVLEKKI